MGRKVVSNMSGLKFIWAIILRKSLTLPDYRIRAASLAFKQWITSNRLISSGSATHINWGKEPYNNLSPAGGPYYFKGCQSGSN